MRADLLITDCRLATMIEGGEPYGAIEDGAILIADGRIVWAGLRADLPSHDATQTDRLDGRWVTPGLIDCHTHLVFGGDRSGEFEQRLGGRAGTSRPSPDRTRAPASPPRALSLSHWERVFAGRPSSLFESGQ